MMLNHIEPPSNQRRGGLLLDVDHIICHESVSTKNEIQCTLTLPDPTFAQDEDPYPKNIDEHTVDAAGRGKLFFQEFGDPLYEIKRPEVGSKQWNIPLVGFMKKEFGNFKVSSDDQARYIQTTDLTDHLFLLF
jgi:hypothetical protein